MHLQSRVWLQEVETFFDMGSKKHDEKQARTYKRIDGYAPGAERLKPSSGLAEHREFLERAERMQLVAMRKRSGEATSRRRSAVRRTWQQT